MFPQLLGSPWPASLASQTPPYFKDSLKSSKCVLRTPKSNQKAAKIEPWELSSRKSQKSETYQKHQYLLCFEHIQALGPGMISIPRTLKTTTLKPIGKMGDQQQEKLAK